MRDTSTLVGDVLGGTYRVDRRLGAGGMGAVFEATHVRTGRRYALKVLLPEVAVRREAVDRFRREAEAVGALGHANVVAIHDFVVEEEWAYLVMDRLEGEDLAARLERLGRLSLGEVLSVADGIAAGLEAAHAHGLVHRDLKPANVFLAHQPGAPERPVLLDFGLAKSFAREDSAKLTASGVVLGTPQYMSPEQAAGHRLDARADLYAFATIVYEMLAGRPPFEAP
ncbi:MAG TPA: serine/threonine-protein kinase, partial [Sandaracinaceae bacterium LLY-WYZ-13_1]|nr:serine/threonine-protein kinase [Sandaracinaceae bacterium LLY-WYZ-13_1]